MKKKQKQAQRLLRFKRVLIKILFGMGLRPYESTWKPAMILGLSYAYGHAPNVLATVSGYDLSLCRRVMKQCRAAGIWRGETIRMYPLSGEAGDLAFLLDAMVGNQELIRQIDSNTAAARKRRHTARLQAGLCVACGRPQDTEGRKTCTRCRASVRAAQQRRKARITGAFTPKFVEADPKYSLAKGR